MSRQTTPSILITGSNGQLGNEFRSLCAAFPSLHFYFTAREDLPVDDEEAVDRFFAVNRPGYCINCAAYTAVDKAETDKEAAYRINRDAVKYMAKASRQYGTKLLHISTDYVFDGTSSIPYKEDDDTGPGNIYGHSKMEGENAAIQHNEEAIAIRTSWIYSSFGTNFVKTMLRLMNERESINVVNDQTGSPTYAADLAAACMHIIGSGRWQPGIYHYSNSGRITWYEFATAIQQLTGSKCLVNPISSSQFPMPAKRPSFSLLDASKIKNTFALSIPDWHDSLRHCLEQMNVLAKK